ncbi:hypothetical protein KVR01_001882 [Diaporthe batatas]|uniref:uncharacterized protein n=1 Tax=Diaporthe batatas TaxID=748121 RepID=UPI001D040474|nr:uncharacterized protein KVR01_001882 [Diaporthe batatas]KAG8169133.1 hypothetical protein KVR01_001882 [Diaporthe batatas]
MRLINLDTLALESFIGYGKIPPYAILSHTWGPDEVSYADITTKPREELEQRAGYQKILKFGQFVRDADYSKPAGRDPRYDGDRRSGRKYNASPVRPATQRPTHIWVDTCCIDKSSSSELSEAINSMFAWYEEATFCVAFLDDYDHPSDAPPSQVDLDRDAFKRRRWFTRGWTLQELLAPAHLYFVDKNWVYLGAKSGLSDLIEAASGIHTEFLMNGLWRRANIAKRLSWAAKRETTRPEDLAYCLLGIFDVHMPLLYGEGGQSAFVRLQEEIIKEFDDHSIFAWGRRNQAKDGPWNESPNVHIGALASHPSQFLGLDNLQTYPGEEEEPYTVTNKGIRILLPIVEIDNKTKIAIIRCHTGEPHGGFMGIYIEDCEDRPGVHCRSSGKMALACVSDNVAQMAETKLVFLLKKTTLKHESIETMPSISSISVTAAHNSGYDIVSAAPEELWDTKDGTLTLRRRGRLTATALISMDRLNGKGPRQPGGAKEYFVLLLRVDPSSRWGFPDVGLVAWRRAGKAQTRDLERCHLTNQDSVRPHTAQLRLRGRYLRTVTAKVGIEMVGEERTYVVSLMRE